MATPTNTISMDYFSMCTVSGHYYTSLLHILLVWTTLGVHYTDFVIVLLKFQYYKHKLYSRGHGMTPTLFLIVPLKFQYYKQKLFNQMYKPGEHHCRMNHSDWRRPPTNCLSLEADTNFFTMHLSYIVGLAVPIGHS